MAMATHAAVLLMIVPYTVVFAERSLSCQGEALSLSCVGNKVLVIDQAIYGHVDSGVCNSDSQVPACSDPDALSDLSRKCFGQSYCFIRDDEKELVFNGNPCPGIQKYVDVTYSCVDPSKIHSICQNTHVLTAASGYVTSSNYPSTYNSSLLCRLEIQASEGQSISVRMLDMDLEYQQAFARCDDQLVFILSPYNHKIYCTMEMANNDREWTYSPDRQQQNILASFESSEHHQRTGFVFAYEVNGCPTAEVPAAPANSHVVAFSADQVHYSCDPGFQLLASDTLSSSCVGTQWEVLHGNCVPVSEGSPTTAIPGNTASTTTPTTTTTTTTIPTTTTTPATTPTTTIPTTTTPTTTTTTPTTTISTTTAPTTTTTTSTTTISTTTLTNTPSTTPTTTTTTFSTTSTRTTAPTTPTTSPTTTTSITQSSTSTTSTSTGPTTPTTTISSTTTTTDTSTSSSTSTTTTTRPIISTTTRTTRRTSPGSGDGENTESTDEDMSRVTSDAPDPVGPGVTNRSTSEARELIIIACSAGFFALMLIIVIVILVRRILERQHIRQKVREMNTAESLRPSKHACASMPNSYAGVGFSTKNAGSMSTRSSVRNSKQEDNDQNSNSTLSFDSATYDMLEEEGRATGYQNGFVINRYGDEMTDSESGLIANEVLDSGRSLSPIQEESNRNSEISVDSSVREHTDILYTNMRPRSLENTKGAPEPRPPPVEYPLFKDDTTGNLENYLDARRVSV